MASFGTKNIMLIGLKGHDGTDANITTEDFTVAAGEWTSVLNAPFTKAKILTVSATIGVNSIVSLGGMSVTQQATHGIVIGDVVGQQVVIYAISEPTEAVTGKIIIMG